MSDSNSSKFYEDLNLSAQDALFPSNKGAKNVSANGNWREKFPEFYRK